MNLDCQSENSNCFTPDNQTENDEDDEGNKSSFRKSKRTRKESKADSERSGHIPILEKLKQHPCDTKHTYNPATKRMNKVITCLYEGCGKKFTKTWNILDHFKVHTGEKPFKCAACKRAFSQKGNLTKHLKLHIKCARYIQEHKIDLDTGRPQVSA